MVIGMEQSGRDLGDATGSSIYVLRDPRDGVVFFVGHTSRHDPVSGIDPSASGPELATASARERAIRAAGFDVEMLIVASGLAGEAEATTVEQAVVAAYAAARLAPSSLVTAQGVPSRDPSIERRLGNDPFDDADVRVFVEQAAAEIDRLSTALERAEEKLAHVESADFLDANHRGRLEALILQQESELTELNARLGRVRALRDLGQWAAVGEGGHDSAVTVRIEDLNRALD